MKSNKSFLLILAVVICAFLSLSFFRPSSRLAYVDSAKLLSGYNAMIEARNEFDKKQAVWKTNIDSLAGDVQNSINNYNNMAVNGSNKEKQLAKELISVKQKQLYDYQSAIRQNAGEEEQRLTQQVLTTVNAYLQRYGQKQGYDLILIAAGGNIAYADTGLDITDKIVEALNKEFAVPVK